MNVTFDTNVLVRLTVADDPAQVAAAQRLLADAAMIALPLVTLCETVWTLRRIYRRSAGEIAEFLSAFLSDERVKTNFALVEIGLDQLRNGGDFADAVIALEGQHLGGETLATFDKNAAKLLKRQGMSVTLLP